MANRMQEALDQEVERFCKERFISPTLRSGAIINKGVTIDADKRTVDGIISTEAIDRDEEIVSARGLDLDKYRTNPIVLFMHDAYSPIGKCSDGPTRRKRNGTTELVATTTFADTSLAKEVFDLVKGEFLRGISIGMAPLSVECSAPTPDEIRKRPDWANARRIIRKAELMEYSFVSIPANADALTTAVSKGMIKLIESVMERFVRVITDANPRKTIVRAVPRVVVKVVEVPLAPPKPVDIKRKVRIARALKAGRL